MEEHVIVDSSFSAIINALLEEIDIPSWCFSRVPRPCEATVGLSFRPAHIIPTTLYLDR